MTLTFSAEACVLVTACFVFCCGAAEAVVGLALALAVFRNRVRVDVDDVQEIQG